MKHIIKISSEFELLSENSDGFLVSGFSTALTAQSNEMMYGGTNILCNSNNCVGGNCASGCGKEKEKSAPTAS